MSNSIKIYKAEFKFQIPIESWVLPDTRPPITYVDWEWSFSTIFYYGGSTQYICMVHIGFCHIYNQWIVPTSNS